MSWTPFDFNGDGTSDFVDYMIWKTEIVPESRNSQNPFSSDNTWNPTEDSDSSSDNNPFSWNR